MKLTELKIENFRSFEDETIRFDDYTCFVGPNGSGKSAILMALNVFFRENASTVTDVLTLSEEDFHHRNIRDPVKITLTFEDLSERAQEDLKHYYRQGKLVLFAKAVWDEKNGNAPVMQYGSRFVMKEFAAFFEAVDQGKRVGELREIYQGIRRTYSELPDVATKAAMTDALREYEEGHPELCTLIDDSSQLYGWTRGQNRLAPHIQWVYIPAVKDASLEQEESSKTALGQLLGRTVRTKLDFGEDIDTLKGEVEDSYKAILDQKAEALSELELSIQKRLQDYIDARAKFQLRWHYDAKASIAIKDPAARARIGDGEFIGEVSRAGHGLQRGFLVSLLHELVGNEEKGGPKLFLGFEEPELYQHPPQAKHLAYVLERLSLPRNNSQIILTTHSPYFVSTKGFENVRMVRKERSGRVSKVNSMSFKNLQDRLSSALGEEPCSQSSLIARIAQIMEPSQNELFFSTVAVLVEGQEDVAFISTQLGLSTQLSQFRKLGCHFVVAGGKTNLSRLVAIALEFKIPFYVVFDADSDESDQGERVKHERDNSCLMALCSASGTGPFPTDTFWGANVVVWPTKIAKVVHKDFGNTDWDVAEAEARQKHDLTEGVRAKNAMLIAYTLEELNAQSKQSKSLIKLCGSILRYAEKAQIALA